MLINTYNTVESLVKFFKQLGKQNWWARPTIINLGYTGRSDAMLLLWRPFINDNETNIVPRKSKHL